MNRVTSCTCIWVDGYEDSANNCMRKWLWIECQQSYEKMVVNRATTSKYTRGWLWIRVPTNVWQDGYEYNANKDKEWWLLKQCQRGCEVMVMSSYSVSTDMEGGGVF
jgi:hypothetical protein